MPSHHRLKAKKLALLPERSALIHLFREKEIATVELNFLNWMLIQRRQILSTKNFCNRTSNNIIMINHHDDMRTKPHYQIDVVQDH